jgi:hypothetical protein
VTRLLKGVRNLAVLGIVLLFVAAWLMPESVTKVTARPLGDGPVTTRTLAPRTTQEVIVVVAQPAKPQGPQGPR